jgi:hypothetical protein
MGLFFTVRVRPLVPVKGNLNATAFNDILDNSVLLNSWQRFGIKWNANEMVRGLASRPTSVILTNALEWKQVPAAMFQHLVESLPRRVEAVIAEKGGTNSILMPMIFAMRCWV